MSVLCAVCVYVWLLVYTFQRPKWLANRKSCMCWLTLMGERHRKIRPNSFHSHHLWLNTDCVYVCVCVLENLKHDCMRNLAEHISRVTAKRARAHLFQIWNRIGLVYFFLSIYFTIFTYIFDGNGLCDVVDHMGEHRHHDVYSFSWNHNGINENRWMAPSYSRFPHTQRSLSEEMRVSACIPACSLLAKCILLDPNKFVIISLSMRNVIRPQRHRNLSSGCTGADRCTFDAKLKAKMGERIWFNWWLYVVAFFAFDSNKKISTN